jgi:hypothetical protein
VPATDAIFTNPQYVGTDSAGDVFVGDLSDTQTIYEIPKTTGLFHGNSTVWTAGDIYPIVGVGGGESSIGSLAGMAVAPDGTVYWSDSSSNAIYSLGPNASMGNVLVDSGSPAVDGSETLGTPGVLAVDPANGLLYLANHCSSCAQFNTFTTTDYYVVEEVDPNSDIQLTDIAPGSTFEVSGLAVDSLHNVYISDIRGLNGVGAKTQDDEVLRVTPSSGVPLVVAGDPTPPTPPAPSYANGVPATSTSIGSPFGIAYNPATGNLTIAQTPTAGSVGIGAQAVRIVSGVEHVAGETYTPGPLASGPI